MKRWIVYCDSDTDPEYQRGDMVSETGDVAKLAPAAALAARGRAVVEVDITDPDPEEARTGRIDYRVRRWDRQARAIVRKVTVDRLQDLLTDDRFAEFRALFAALTPAQKQIVRDALILLLGPRRFRIDGEDSVELQ